MHNPSNSLNCPQCGNALPLSFRFAKLTVCESCGSAIFLEDDAARLAGTSSSLADLPSILQLKIPFTYLNNHYLPVGHVRYRYEHGFWDEWWVLDNGGDGQWLSVDEGDYAFELPLKLNLKTIQLPTYQQLFLGKVLKVEGTRWSVTELDHATCEGFKGELPEIITVGETFDYAHLSTTEGGLMTLEYLPDGSIQAYRGKWVDAYEIKADV